MVFLVERCMSPIPISRGQLSGFARIWFGDWLFVVRGVGNGFTLALSFALAPLRN